MYDILGIEAQKCEGQLNAKTDGNGTQQGTPSQHTTEQVADDRDGHFDTGSTDTDSKASLAAEQDHQAVAGAGSKATGNIKVCGNGDDKKTADHLYYTPDWIGAFGENSA